VNPDCPKARRSAAEQIATHADKFFVCEGCDNVFRRGGTVEQAGLCPYCKSFRFNHEPEFVAATARSNANRPRQTPLPQDYL